MSEVNSVEERLAALEATVEVLEEKYKDVAYTYLDSLVKRIEEIREETFKELSSVVDQERIDVATDNAVKALRAEAAKLKGAVVSDVAEEVLVSLTDGSHGMVRVAGSAHPVLQRIK
jgi:hypothetical protein